MRRLFQVLMVIGITTVADAFPPGAEELNFEYLPALDTGARVHVTRTEKGEITCSAHELPIRDKGGVAEHENTGAMLARDVRLSGSEFEELVRELESERLRDEAQAYTRTGLDGVVFKFSHRRGARFLEYSYWCPGNTSAAMHLAAHFAAVAKIEQPWNASKPANKGPLPKPDTVTPSGLHR